MAWYIAFAGYVLTYTVIPLVLVRKRHATSAIAWCLAILLLPGLGALLFLTVGTSRVNRKLRRKTFHRTRFIVQWVSTVTDQPHELHTTPARADPAEWERINRLACAVGAVRTSGGNQIQIYHDGPSAIAAKLAAIEKAEYHVHLEYYIFRDDGLGRQLLNLLCEKARAGVEVRLLLDAVGSPAAKRLIRRIRDAGGRGRRFLPIASLRRRFVINLRNHRKILVCDGKVAFTGGVNIGDEYLSRSRYGFWRDTHLAVRGPAALGLQRVFVEDWDFASEEFLSGAAYFPEPRTDGPSRAQVVWSGPDHTHEAVHQVMIGIIGRAQRSLWITTPYFVPTSGLLTAIKNAALRGVDVRILTQSYPPDTWLVYWGGRYYWEELLGCGVRIFQYDKGMLHAKTMVADGACAVVGSSNLDVRSLRLNFEANCLLYTPECVQALIAQFEQDLTDSTEVLWPSFVDRPWTHQLAENACRLFTPIL